MPTVARWANDLRAAFGKDVINDAMRQYGYMADEAGRRIDTRINTPSREFIANVPPKKTPHPTKDEKR